MLHFETVEPETLGILRRLMAYMLKAVSLEDAKEAVLESVQKEVE